MIKPGICSVTFREKTVEEVVQLAVEVGLDAGETFGPVCFEAADEPDGERFALVEFMRDDSAEQFLQDAAVLRKWLE